jgi:hypothetical protein
MTYLWQGIEIASFFIEFRQALECTKALSNEYLVKNLEIDPDYKSSP